MGTDNTQSAVLVRLRESLKEATISRIIEPDLSKKLITPTYMPIPIHHVGIGMKRILLGLDKLKPIVPSEEIVPLEEIVPFEEKVTKTAKLTSNLASKLREAGLLKSVQKGQYRGLEGASSGPLHLVPKELRELNLSSPEYNRLVRHIEGRSAASTAVEGQRQIRGINLAGEAGTISEREAVQLLDELPFLQNLSRGLRAKYTTTPTPALGLSGKEITPHGALGEVFTRDLAKTLKDALNKAFRTGPLSGRGLPKDINVRVRSQGESPALRLV